MRLDRPASVHVSRVLASLVALVLTLTACGDAGTVSAPPSERAITGVVRVDQALSAATPPAALHATTASADGVVRELPPPVTATGGAHEDDVIPGEILVVFRSGDDDGAVGRASVTVHGTALERARPLAVADGGVYRAAGASAAETIALAAELARRSDVLAAAPNRVVRAFLEPNDELYERLWGLAAIRMPSAWGVTTGSSDVVVAVVDTGVRGRPGQSSATHPDLRGKLLPGYDFVDRDTDPFDPGTFASNQTHGTHVAGIIAARTNDGVGIAGVDWSAMVLPVRVLDRDGLGSMADVLDGVTWAAGLSVTGVPANLHPADVINVSLGGSGGCSSVEQLVFDRVAAAGAMVVAAAGNRGLDASTTTPASCANVIAVGATDREGWRAPYSNHGPVVDLMAPGGDLGAIGPDGTPNGILSAVDDGGPAWALLQGTSMAAPHVAGVLALMRSVDPTITPPRALSVLRATAVPLGRSACNGRTPAGLSGSDCGAGLLDAHAALLALGSGAPAPTPPEPAPPPPAPDPEPEPEPSQDVDFRPERLDFGERATTLELKLRNTGDTAADWSLRGFSAWVGNPASLAGGVLTVDVASGRLAPGASTTITLTLDRSELAVSGAYALDLVFDVGDTRRSVPLHFEHAVTDTTLPSLAGTVLLACAPTPSGCDARSSTEIVVRAGSVTSAPYVIDGLDATEYVVIGWNDLNGNGKVDAGDLFGFYSRDDVAATPLTPPARGADVSLRVLKSQAAEADAVVGEAVDALRAWLAAR